MKGHLLVLPKRHIESLSELKEEEKKELFDTAIEFQEKILEISKGCDLRQNYRPFQKQEELKVHHLHIHLQPRELFDDLYEKCQVHEKELFKEIEEKEMDEVTSKLG